MANVNSQAAVGIDLGTSTSEIAVFRNGAPYLVADPATKSPIIPSLVAMDRRGELLVGSKAGRWVDLPGQGIREVKRLMGTGQTVRLGDREYRPEQISSLVLRHLVETAEEAMGFPIKDVVVSVPANFPDPARQATRNAGELAGLNILRLINEPTAAALAFGINNIDLEEQLIVFDFGGGTLDITVLEMVDGIIDIKSSYGDPQLGGKDFDAAMTELILRKFRAERPNVSLPEDAARTIKEYAEVAKKELSTGRNHYVRVPGLGMEGGLSATLEVEISRDEYEREISPLLERARACVRQALRAKEVRPSVIDRVLMVGGTTYMPAVRQLVAEMFGREPYLDPNVNPDLAVAMGVSIQAGLAKGLVSEEKSIILTDVAPFGLGIEVLREVGGQYLLTYEPLIQPNTTIPYSTQRNYSLMHIDQNQVEVRIYQDHLGRARLPEEAIDTGIFAVITDIPPSLSGVPHPIEVDFSYDIDGNIHLNASIPSTGQSINIEEKPSSLRLSEKEKAVMKEEVEDLWRQSDQAKRYEPLLNKADRMISEFPSAEADALSQAVTDLKQALSSNDPEEIRIAGDRLTDLLFDMENDL